MEHSIGTEPAPAPEAWGAGADHTGLPPLAERLKALRVLQAVVRHGSAVRAAEAIHLSQPAVTRAVLELERACQTPLFVRAARGMVPTPAGTRVAQRAGTVFLMLAYGASEALTAAPGEAQRPVQPERFAAAVSIGSLRALAAVATQGSEARAAQALGVTQPAVHTALQALEHLLGLRLFYKSAQGTRLTPSGQALLRRVKLAFSEIRAIEGDIAAWRGEIRGRVVVGVLPLSVPLFLPRAVEALLQAHPSVEVQVVDGTYDSLLQQLLSADIDVIAGALRAEASPAEVRQHCLFEDDLAVVAQRGHPCLALPAPTLRDLLRWDWVIPLPGSPAAAALARVFREQGLPPPRGRLQAGSPTLTQAFTQQTGRLALASRGQALAEREGPLCLVPVALPGTRRRIGTVVRALSEPAPELQRFLQACAAAVPAFLRGDGRTEETDASVPAGGSRQDS
ncbi:LysR family transcriptional regulator [Azohydromonas australica]|uniref:LysR family transcriptional regulator n=1 Tax=Azohydromonas australica TaxID=364039 RepID=UPI0004085B64|nr:LysR family transcriptional regulator [Azohydromonas australica]